MSEFSEVVEGIAHWSSFHERIRQRVHSYYLPEQRLAVDPMVGEGVAEELSRRGGLELCVLTNRHHLRGAAALRRELGGSILAPAVGMGEFDDRDGVEPYRWGEELATGVTAHEVGAICPDDGALHIDVGPGALALADGVIRWDGELSFVPDFLMDDPDQVKRRQLAALGGLLELRFDALLLAHGDPLPSGGRDELERFVAEPRQAEFGG